MEIAERIRRAAEAGAMPHAIIFSGAGDRLSAATLAAAAMECTAASGVPCGVCRNCRKAMGGIHPDVITVHDKEHKTMAVDLLRSLCADVYIRPNEGKRKVYLFDDCAQLDERCQNLLLKTVEEGPPYAAFLFCAENSAALLPTLRSRCVEWKLGAGEESRAGEDDSRARELCRALCTRRMSTVVECLTALEGARPAREELGQLLEQCRCFLTAALLADYGRPASPETAEIAGNLRENLTKRQLMRTIEVMQTYRRQCDWNVGVGHVLGALAAELEGIL